MQHCIRCHLSLNFRVEEMTENFNITSAERFPAPQFDVVFQFVCKPVTECWVLRQDSSLQFVRRVDQPWIETFVLVNHHQFSCHEKARETIARELEGWPVRANWRLQVIDFALRQARRVVQRAPESHNSVYLRCPAVVVRRQVYHERLAIRSVTLRSMEGGEARMVPAAESSIESLESKMIATDSAETCTVCMEAMSPGCEATRMPCSHAFHGDCIKKWLRTSHCCPVCRFEMPTSL